jgi:hypothetical protein
MNFQKKTPEQRLSFFNMIIDKLEKKVNEKDINHIRTFFAWAFPAKTKDLYDFWYTRYLNDFKTLLLRIDDDYEYFLNRSLNTFDVYGLGLTFMNIAIKTIKQLDNKMSWKILNWAYNMMNPNLYVRYSIDMAIKELDRILKKKEILIVDVRKDITSDIELLPCPEGKEMNPKRRCIKKCKAGYTRRRNLLFRCVKECKEGYTRNENYRCIKPCKEGYTRKKRCLKDCKKGYTRNAKNRCVKD